MEETKAFIQFLKAMSQSLRLVRAALSRSAVKVARTTPRMSAATSRLHAMSTLSGGSALTEMAKENPYKDVVRYEHKNRKWNLQHVDFYSEALAIGLLENGLQPGDVVLSWLPAHFSESVGTETDTHKMLVSITH